MRNLLQLIARYSNFLLLVGLEVVAFLLVVHFNHYQRTVLFSASNKLAAGVQQVKNNVTSYFRLRTDNTLLLQENAALRQTIQEQQNKITMLGEALDTCYTYSEQDYTFIPATVIAYTDDRRHNYLTLNKGARDGIAPDMGVIGMDGLVGVVSEVSTHFSVVTPIVHEGMYLSVMLQKNGYMATLHWQAPDVRRAALEDIARHVHLQVGDTIVSSGMSAVFPANIPVGTVKDIQIGEGDSYYDVDVLLATDFRNVHTVHVLAYPLRSELDSISLNAKLR